MIVDKDKSIVINQMYIKYPKRFFAMCGSLGINGETEKEYWKKVMGVGSIKELNTSQWEVIFEDLEKRIKNKAESEGVVFAQSLDEALENILGGDTNG